VRILVVDDNHDTADALAPGRARAYAWRAAREAGFDRLLLKPIGLAALEEALVLRTTA
jgi:hypothetical protein